MLSGRRLTHRVIWRPLDRIRLAFFDNLANDLATTAAQMRADVPAIATHGTRAIAPTISDELRRAALYALTGEFVRADEVMLTERHVRAGMYALTGHFARAASATKSENRTRADALGSSNVPERANVHA